MSVVSWHRVTSDPHYVFLTSCGALMSLWADQEVLDWICKTLVIRFRSDSNREHPPDRCERRSSMKSRQNSSFFLFHMEAQTFSCSVCHRLPDFMNMWCVAAAAAASQSHKYMKTKASVWATTSFLFHLVHVVLHTQARVTGATDAHSSKRGANYIFFPSAVDIEGRTCKKNPNNINI